MQKLTVLDNTLSYRKPDIQRKIKTLRVFFLGFQAQEEAGYVSLFIQEGHTGVPGSIQRVLDVYKNEVRLGQEFLK